MSFDPWNPNQNPIPKTYPLPQMIYYLMSVVMESNDPFRAGRLISEVILCSPKDDEKQIVRSQEIWELKEIEKEVMELKRLYRKDSNELVARIYAIKFLIITNWLALFLFVVCYSFYYCHHGYLHIWNLIPVQIVLAVFIFAVLALTQHKWFEITPLPDEEASRIRKHYDELKSQLKLTYNFEELRQEQKQLIRLFLKDFLVVRKTNKEMKNKLFDLKLKSAIPVGLFMLGVFLFYIINGILSEGEQRSSYFSGAGLSIFPNFVISFIVFAMVVFSK